MLWTTIGSMSQLKIWGIGAALSAHILLPCVCCLEYHVLFSDEYVLFLVTKSQASSMYQILVPKFKYMNDSSEKEFGTTKRKNITQHRLQTDTLFRKYYPLESRVIDSREQGLLPWSSNLTHTHFECLYIQIAFYCWVLSSSGYRILKPVVCTVPPKKSILTIISLLHRRPLKIK